MEDVFGGAMGGAGAGAGIGSMFPGPGTAIGAGVGALAGGIGGWFKHRGRQKQKAALGQARMQIEDLARDQRQQRADELEKAMSFFGPAQAEMKRLYGG